MLLYLYYIGVVLLILNSVFKPNYKKNKNVITIDNTIKNISSLSSQSIVFYIEKSSNDTVCPYDNIFYNYNVDIEPIEIFHYIEPLQVNM